MYIATRLSTVNADQRSTKMIEQTKCAFFLFIVCNSYLNSSDAANLPQHVKDKMRLILDEEASLGQSAEDSDSVDESQSL